MQPAEEMMEIGENSAKKAEDASSSDLADSRSGTIHRAPDFHPDSVSPHIMHLDDVHLSIPY